MVFYCSHRIGDILRVIRQVTDYYNTGAKVTVMDISATSVTVEDEYGVECTLSRQMIAMYLESTGERCFPGG
jgi:hypothetical protein